MIVGCYIGASVASLGRGVVALHSREHVIQRRARWRAGPLEVTKGWNAMTAVG
jgi:hypothetical protein